MIIVSNTSPINYLILISHINLLPELFQQIIIPQAVYSELSDASAPSLHHLSQQICVAAIVPKDYRRTKINDETTVSNTLLLKISPRTSSPLEFC